MVSGFRWIIEEKLAGSARPGLLDPFAEDMAFLASRGVRWIITLTEQPLSPSATEFGFHEQHFPISDMGFPTPRSANELCSQIIERMERSEPVLLHCKAGLGRTGLMLACCLVALGKGAEEALNEVRKINPNYVQTASQESFIKHFERHRLQEQAADGGGDGPPDAERAR